MKQLLVLCLFFQFLTVSAFSQQYKYHIVKDGETVFSIAQQYNISEETIYKYNPDAENEIHPGNKLVVPLVKTIAEEDVEFKTIKVKRKETLFNLSQKYNVDIADIKRYNKHLYSEELQRGESIRIPINLPIAASKKTAEETFVKDKQEVNPMNISSREHVVLPKENKFRISQKYNISIEELERLNPQLGVLQPGMVLKVSSEETEVEPEDKIFKYYLVKPQETIFSLTRRFGISKDSLVVLNPALSDGLKSGMVLKIPNLDPFGPTEKYSEENIVNLENKISNYGTKNLAIMLPFNIDEIVVKDTTSNTKERLKRDKVMQIALDFYTGVLMAVDSAKTMGLSTNVQVFDTQQNSGTINNIIRNNNFRNIDAVIGPLLHTTAEATAKKLEAEEVPVISPLTKKGARSLDNFYQTRPSDEMLTEAMLSYLSENAAGKNVVIISDAGSWKIKNELLQNLPAAKTVNPKEGSYIVQSELSSALVKNRMNWVILESDKINILSNATSYLNSLADTYNITLFTTNKNGSFESDNISNRHLAGLNFHFPSVDKGYNKNMENTFMAAYKKEYEISPSTYAVRGFDVTYDILLRLASAENLPASMEEGGTTEYIENKFDYEENPSGGYYNKAIYIMAYDENMNLIVVGNDIKNNLSRGFKDKL